MYLCHCDLRIVLTIEKINMKKNIIEIFIVLNVIVLNVYCIKCYIKSTNYKYLAYHLK